ncbi:DUF2155 domain-containing protein [Acetobacter sp. AN02]|uniref:DUF2155 domain-containing protein n=1 Tax=Acetobacter sp. AN02 TaxID=2894186 RepID=UPI002434583B|nr:DUF2155 domain-containing protein [Acetobacter sp. AN02]MDG6094837.1 DUF2155 domain-containing protein [Acetobacter sp. AN02]
MPDRFRLAAAAFLTAAGLVVTGLAATGPVGSAHAAQPLAPPAIYPPDTWQGQTVAVLRILDRLNAHTDVITVRAGQPETYRTMQITVPHCLSRPETLAADAAAWLDIDDAQNKTSFHGWMITSMPSLGVYESPLFDIRLIRCEGDKTDPTPPPLAAPAVPPMPGQARGGISTGGSPADNSAADDSTAGSDTTSGSPDTAPPSPDQDGSSRIPDVQPPP